MMSFSVNIQSAKVVSPNIKISLECEDNVITNDQELVKTCNDIFQNEISDLPVKEYESNLDIGIFFFFSLNFYLLIH